MKKVLFIVSVAILIIAVGQTYHLFPQVSLEKFLNLPKQNLPQFPKQVEHQKVVYEESVITKVVEESLPSVVTVGIIKTATENDYYQLDPFNPFTPFKQVPGKKKKIDENIGSGFIIGADGLIITNKHVVSDTEASYKILTNDNKKYDIQKIYRDPLNDLAILKVNLPADDQNLKPLPLGDSSTLKLGQMAIAIGTPLGEFRNTVTVGIISGLSRGITAGSPFEGYVEKLDNVIQTDAAISPGNSGGPLLNSKGQVIGINTAIAEGGQNIGFAIPVNVIKSLLENFKNKGGSFDRPYIGIRYKMIDKQTAVLNELVEGAYVIEVVPNSPAEKAGIQEEDIVIEFQGKKIKGDDDQGLAKSILERKIGEKIKLKIWRNKEIKEISLFLEAYK